MYINRVFLVCDDPDKIIVQKQHAKPTHIIIYDRSYSKVFQGFTGTKSNNILTTNL